jgi:hypothetical protein
MNLVLDAEQTEQLQRMIMSYDQDNLKMAMSIIFNVADDNQDVINKKIELYQKVIDKYSWNKFMELYKENLTLFEKGYDIEFIKSLE